MVYSGKPSGACDMCRARKIKCDKTRPGCHRCSKSLRECPGYKNEFDLIHRDETQVVVKRAKKANLKALARKLNDKQGLSFPVCSVSSTSRPILPVLGLSLNELAASYFMSNYVLVSCEGTARGFLEFVPPLMGLWPVIPHFKYAFDACALASFCTSVATGDKFSRQAQAKYVLALEATFAALRDPGMAKHDSTLASVILLGLFENISAKKFDISAWSSHVRGAMQIVRARGRNQLRTDTGLSLFFHVRTQMNILALITGGAANLAPSWDDGDPNDARGQCERLINRTADLGSEVNVLLTSTVRTGENINLVVELIKKCQSLDQEFIKWADNLPRCYDWKTVAWEDKAPGCYHAKLEVFPGPIDVYYGWQAASIINWMRCSRIVLASLIIRSTAWVYSAWDYRLAPEYNAAVRICIENITDIIASVPYILGWFAKHSELLLSTNLSGVGPEVDGTVKALQGYVLIWPLACIRSQDYLTENQRVWVNGRLEYIGATLGVGCATALTQLNLRMPSMLIRRDILLTNIRGAYARVERSNMTRTEHSAAHTSVYHIQQLELMQPLMIKRQMTDLMSKIMGTSGQIDAWSAKTLLQVQHIILRIGPPEEDADKETRYC